MAMQVCINVSGLLAGGSGPGHDRDPRAVGSISWFVFWDRFRAELQRQGIDCAAVTIEFHGIDPTAIGQAEKEALFYSG